MLILLVSSQATSSSQSEDLIIQSLLTRVQALESGPSTQLKELEVSLSLALRRIGFLENQLEILLNARSQSQFSSENPSVPCACNVFNSTSVSIAAADPDVDVNLFVGTPETGFINGVNVYQLANEAILDSGDQSIAGSLTVSSINIGGLWSISVDGNGDLAVTPTISSGSLVILASLSADNIQSHGSVTASSFSAEQGASTFSDIYVSGSINTSSLATTKSYVLCTEDTCLSRPPVFQAIQTNGAFISQTPGSACNVTVEFSCPQGWVPVFAGTDLQAGQQEYAVLSFYGAGSTVQGFFFLYYNPNCPGETNYVLDVTCMSSSS